MTDTSTSAPDLTAAALTALEADARAATAVGQDGTPGWKHLDFWLHMSAQGIGAVAFFYGLYAHDQVLEIAGLGVVGGNTGLAALFSALVKRATLAPPAIATTIASVAGAVSAPSGK